jgi:hypothetical protein
MRASVAPAGQHHALKHVPKQGILRQLEQCDQQQDGEYHQTQWQ